MIFSITLQWMPVTSWALSFSLVLASFSAFAKLWQRINRKTFYTVSFDTQELIDRSVRALDAHLNISKVYVKTEYGEQTARLTSREQLEQGQAFVKRHNDQDAADRVALGLTRATIAAILQGIAPLVFAQYKLNPEDFIIKAGKSSTTKRRI